jgi:hypothetical protein
MWPWHCHIKQALVPGAEQKKRTSTESQAQEHVWPEEDQHQWVVEVPTRWDNQNHIQSGRKWMARAVCSDWQARKTGCSWVDNHAI